MGSIGLSLADQSDLYGNPGGLSSATGRPPSGGLIQSMGRSSSGGLLGHGGGGGSGGSGGQCQTLGGQSRGIKRTSSDCYDDHHRSSGGGLTSQTLQGLESCGGAGSGQSTGNVPDVVDDSYTSLQNKKSPPANGKKTKGRVKIKMEYIDNKLRRYTTFSKRKTGIMKKAYELSTLTGTQVMLLVASETGHVYTFATRKLQPMITSEAGKQLIQTCLNSPDPPSGGGGDQRMSATGFEETELSYNIADEDSKDDRSPISTGDSDDSSDVDSPGPPSLNNSQGVLTDAPILDHVSNLHPQSSHLPSPSSAQLDALKSSTLTHLSNISNVLYPNISQEFLLGLVQSGHLQLHAEEESNSHQLTTIPLSMAPSTTTSNTSLSSISGGNCGGVQGNAAGNKHHIKDLSKKATNFSTLMSTSENGRESPPKEGIRIKKEIIE